MSLMRRASTVGSLFSATPTHLFSWSVDGYLYVVALVACICLGWTAWLMLLTVAPNQTINRLMDTETFDEGSFWRFIEPKFSALILGLSGLRCVALAYIYIIVRVTLCRYRKFSGLWKVSTFQYTKTFGANTIAVAPPASWSISRLTQAVSTIDSSRIARPHSSKQMSGSRDFLNIAFKFVDFGIQIYLLIDMMEMGLPIVIIVIFASSIALNALVTSVMITEFSRHSGLPELLRDTIFDIIVAVGIPMLVLVYCLATFKFDRKLLAINLEVFPPGMFERGASVNSDPVQPEIIRSALNSLRIFSEASVFARVGTNCALCRRFYQLADLIKDPTKRRQQIYPKHLPSAILFVMIAIITILVVEESIRTSSAACQPHPECVQHAKRWVILHNDDQEQCPCLKLIIKQSVVKTYAKWLDPPNVAKKVSQLSVSGDLQMVSLVNQRLPTLPEELRRCRNLRHLSLMYTNTDTIPPWVKEFTMLEHLHIEGKYKLSKLTEIPQDIFGDMRSLTFLHLAAIPLLTLPPMQNLENLKYFALAELLSIHEIPSFEGLHNLETLILAIVPMVDSIPDSSPLVNLKMFTTLDRGMFCCNGFISNCNLKHSMCMRHLIWDSPPASCLSPNRTTKLPTVATRETFTKFGMTVCADQARKPGELDIGPTKETSEQCAGILYRQCVPPEGGVGICYNARMMGIACGQNYLQQVMRRRQIAEGVGDPCNPDVESWLGCK